jgi:trehalose 6-phosphate phosphatase
MTLTAPNAAAIPALQPPPRLAELDRPALFLDFDGTLVDLIDKPEEIVVDGELVSLLGGLADRVDGRLAIVSGRSIEQLDGFLGPLGGTLGFAGSHGAEQRWRGEAVAAPPPSPAMALATGALEDFARDHPGVLVERKTHGVTLHFRLAPDAGPLAHAAVERVGAEHGFPVQAGKFMVELKSTTVDKGAAVAWLAARAEFTGATPVFIGDDLTDEAGFVAAGAHGGSGILVGPPRATAARWHLGDVAGVRAWLRAGMEELA